MRLARQLSGIDAGWWLSYWLCWRCGFCLVAAYWLLVVKATHRETPMSQDGPRDSILKVRRDPAGTHACMHRLKRMAFLKKTPSLHFIGPPSALPVFPSDPPYNSSFDHVLPLRFTSKSPRRIFCCYLFTLISLFLSSICPAFPHFQTFLSFFSTPQLRQKTLLTSSTMGLRSSSPFARVICAILFASSTAMANCKTLYVGSNNGQIFSYSITGSILKQVSVTNDSYPAPSWQTISGDYLYSVSETSGNDPGTITAYRISDGIFSKVSSTAGLPGPVNIAVANGGTMLISAG